MWIKKSEYKRLHEEIIEQTNTNRRLMNLINDVQKQYYESRQEVERIKEKAFTRRQILSEMSYRDLVLIAGEKYGIRPQNYDDKADLIEEILCVEKRLEKAAV